MHQALTIAFASLSLALAMPAVAQEGGQVVMRSSMSSISTGASGGLTRDRVGRMAELLGYDDVQSEIAMDLFRELAQARQESSDAMRQEISSAREDAQSGDLSAMMTKIQDATAKHQQRVQTLESTFLEDLQALLLPDQADQWPKAERLYRRGKHLGSLLRSAARVDLDELVQDEFPQASQEAEVADVLERWSVRVDAHLIDRERKAASIGGPDFRGGVVVVGGDEDAYKELREIDARIASTTEQSVRTLMGVLQDDSVHTHWIRKAFPRVYRPLDAERRLDAALALEDLSTEQREQLDAAASQHRRDAGSARDRWVEAEKEREANDWMPAGIVMVIDGQEPTPSDRARQALADVGNRLEERLAAILTAEQLAELPQAEPQTESRLIAPGGRTIRIGG